MTDHLSRVDAVGLAGLVRRKEMSATELVQAAIARIEAVNPTVNAVVTPLFDEALAEADVVMMLRIQLERQGKTLLPTMKEYSRYYGLNPDNLKLAKKDAMVMHPGPINRGVEMSSYVVDGDQSFILKQVENGVAVRMAMLYHVSGGELPTE